MISSAKLLNSLISDIIDYSSISKGVIKIEIQKLNIQLLILDCLNLFSLQAQKKNLTLETEFKIINMIIENDQNRLKQILNNLLQNAVKFTFKGNVKIIVQEF